MKLQVTRFTKKSGWTVELGKLANLDSKSTTVFVFGAPDQSRDAGVFQSISENFPLACIVGCSSAGEIFGNQVYDDSLSIAILKLEKSTVRSVVLPIADSSQSFAVGKQIGESLKGENLASVFLLTDGLAVNGSDLIHGVQGVLPNTVVTGGLAGDGNQFTKTWVLKEGKPTAGMVSAVGFYGKSLVVRHGIRGGWDIFGPERSITKSEGNVLFELDGKPALALYKEYLGEKSSGLPATALFFPLQVRASVDDERKLTRTVLAVNEAQESMTFAGNIPQGGFAQLMRTNFDRLIEGSSSAAVDSAGDGAHSGPVLALAISCVGRRLVLGERTNEEIESAVEQLPKGSQLVGFYSYGEISPLVQGQSCELHNQTMTITTLSEK